MVDIQTKKKHDINKVLHAYLNTATLSNRLRLTLFNKYITRKMLLV